MGRYININTIKSNTGKQHYRNVLYPEVELDEDDIYVIATDGDRYDKLALQFYKDSSLWWIIAAANNTEDSDSITIYPGTQVRIPAHPEKYERYLREFNS